MGIRIYSYYEQCEMTVRCKIDTTLLILMDEPQLSRYYLVNIILCTSLILYRCSVICSRNDT